MGTIETTYDLPNDLTTFRVVGEMMVPEFHECLDGYYEGDVTPYPLWDFIEADISTVTTNELTGCAQYDLFQGTVSCLVG